MLLRTDDLAFGAHYAALFREQTGYSPITTACSGGGSNGAYPLVVSYATSPAGAAYATGLTLTAGHSVASCVDTAVPRKEPRVSAATSSGVRRGKSSAQTTARYSGPDMLPSARVLVMGQPAMLLPAPGSGPGLCQSAEQIPGGPPQVSVTQVRVKGM